MTSVVQARTVKLTRAVDVFADRLWVPTARLSRGERSLTLVGVCHIAEASFWASVRDLITETREAGGVVQSELVEGIPRGGLVKFFSSITRDLLAEQRLVPQEKGLPYDEGFIEIADMTWGDIRDVKGLGAYTLLAGAIAGNLLFGKLPRKQLIAGLAGRETLSARDDALHFMREVVAINAIETSANGRVMSIWGAAHLPRLVSQLEDGGWTLDKVSWLVALDGRDDIEK